MSDSRYTTTEYEEDASMERMRGLGSVTFNPTPDLIGRRGAIRGYSASRSRTVALNG